MNVQLTAGILLLTATAVVGQTHRAPFELTAVRYWSLADTTRVAIEITGDVHVRSDRVQNPDRIFFDFVGARPLIDGHRLYSASATSRRS